MPRPRVKDHAALCPKPQPQAWGRKVQRAGLWGVGFQRLQGSGFGMWGLRAGGSFHIHKTATTAGWWPNPELITSLLAAFGVFRAEFMWVVL